MAREIIRNAGIMKPSNAGGQHGSSEMKINSSMKNNKPGGSSNPSSTLKRNSVIKAEVKLKAAGSSTSTTTTPRIKVREKKVFSLPGQKYDPPEEREPLRLFYESLFEQIPSSEMAEFWMMEHGLLSLEMAKRASKKKQLKQKMQHIKAPIKSQK